MREIMICENCKNEFYDQWNFLCISTLKFCLKCANNKCNKDELSKIPYGRN